MRIVVLTGGQPNQMALCKKLTEHSEISSIVVSQNVPRKPSPHRWTLRKNRLAGRLVGRPFVSAWLGTLDRYRDGFPAFPNVPIVQVRNVNDPVTVRTLERDSPDLVVVSGTNLVGQDVIRAATTGHGIINLHTGISPYVKGGPNCTNWCLAEGNLHLIGNTVMWLDPGIDSGPIIATEQTPLDGRETLRELHWRVMEHAHDLYCRVVRAFGSGISVPRVPQSGLATGRTFLNAEWNAGAMLRARRHFERHFSPEYFTGPEHAARTNTLRLFPFSMSE